MSGIIDGTHLTTYNILQGGLDKAGPVGTLERRKIDETDRVAENRQNRWNWGKFDLDERRKVAVWRNRCCTE